MIIKIRIIRIEITIRFINNNEYKKNIKIFVLLINRKK